MGKKGESCFVSDSIVNGKNKCTLTLYQTSPCFNVLAVQVFLKTPWEKEKLLVTSNFSFSHSVFLSILRSFCHFSLNLKLSSANSFRLDESNICRLGKV